MHPKLRVNNEIAEKFCSVCQTWKLLTGFSPGEQSHEGSEGGRHCECRECNNARRWRYAAASRGRYEDYKQHGGISGSSRPRFCAASHLRCSWRLLFRGEATGCWFRLNGSADQPVSSSFLTLTGANRKTFRQSPTIAKTPSVRFILEGAVRRHGEHVRATVQQINAFDGCYLWSERYRSFEPMVRLG
jgi:hypothetical protein